MPSVSARLAFLFLPGTMLPLSALDPPAERSETPAISVDEVDDLLAFLGLPATPANRLVVGWSVARGDMSTIATGEG